MFIFRALFNILWNRTITKTPGITDLFLTVSAEIYMLTGDSYAYDDITEVELIRKIQIEIASRSMYRHY